MHSLYLRDRDRGRDEFIWVSGLFHVIHEIGFEKPADFQNCLRAWQSEIAMVFRIEWDVVEPRSGNGILRESLIIGGRITNVWRACSLRYCSRVRRNTCLRAIDRFARLQLSETALHLDHLRAHFF